MKRKQSQSAIETHDISQRKYPMPGTDLGSTTACPFDEAQDVDLSGGRQSSYCLGTGDECSNFSYTDRTKSRELIPAENPTRMRPKRPAWMEESIGGAMPMKGRR